MTNAPTAADARAQRAIAFRLGQALVDHEGDTWRVLQTGRRDDETTLCHLASTTRGWQQRNGWYPVQAQASIPNATLKAAHEEAEAAQADWWSRHTAAGGEA